MKIALPRLRVAVGQSFTSGVLLLVLVVHLPVVALLTKPLYGDAPRNLHWGILTAESPLFLWNQPDPYERIKGFPPSPEALAPRGLYQGASGPLHPWWGPVAPLVLAIVWSTTHSYTLLQLVMPLAAACLVLLTYHLAQRYTDQRTALLAAGFLACFPLFHDYATTSYIEAFSALVLTAAIMAYLAGQTYKTAVLATLAALTKMDLLMIYTCVVGMSTLVTLLHERRVSHWRQTVIALLFPLLIAAPWVWLHYLQAGRGSTAALSLGMLSIVSPQMLELLFYIPWYGSLLTLGVVGSCVVMAIYYRVFPAEVMRVLVIWLLAGIVVLVAYAATPGAGNSPRIIIPALPPLAILFAAGYMRISLVWQRRFGMYLATLFLIINIVLASVYTVQARARRQYEPVWNVLRTLPRGFVLTEEYWATILYARQPATWFEGDAAFQHNILMNQANFIHYLEHTPIRYVVLPRRQGHLASEAVYRYLDATAENRYEFADQMLYTVPRD